MIAFIQRVKKAQVEVAGTLISQINYGILALIGINKNDNQTNADKLIDKILTYRIFPDNEDKMNLSLIDIQGEIILVPQFTLAANTNKGRRPSFDSAMPPKQAEEFFNEFARKFKEKHNKTFLGEFGAYMQVSLVNDGPVSFWLEQ